MRRPGTRSIARHLILAYRPTWQAPSDLSTIAEFVREIDPSIRSFILPVNQRNTLLRRVAAERPTLVVSAGALRRFRPLRGRIYQGARVSKIEEVRHLAAAGVPTPRTEVLTPDLRLDPADWGEFVILKPTDLTTSSHGRGIALTRTRRVRYRAPHEFPDGHPGRLGPMLVQRYVDTGAKPGIYRVLTFMGAPLYAYFIRSGDPPVDLGADDATIENAVVASQAFASAERIFVDDADVLATARAAHESFPDVPLKGCDLIREAATGKLYALEINAGGNTWHFSSAYFSAARNELGEGFVRMLHGQFDAFRTIAGILAERTMQEAQ